jgi:hypothetical protein
VHLVCHQCISKQFAVLVHGFARRPASLPDAVPWPVVVYIRTRTTFACHPSSGSRAQDQKSKSNS